MVKNVFWNYEEGRLRALWRQVMQLLFYFLLIGVMIYIIPWGLAFLLIALHIVLHLLFHISLPPTSRLLELPRNSLIGASAVLLSVWITVRLFNREALALFGFRFSKAWWADFLFGCLLGFALNAGVFLVEWLVGWVSIKQLFSNGVTSFPFAVVLCMGFVNFLLVALFEETLARGYPLRNFAQACNIAALGPQKAILLCWLLTSFVFGFGHYANPHVTVLELLSISIAGLLMGLGYIFTGNLGLSIGLHMAWDFAQGNVFGFSVAGQSLSSSASVFSLRQAGPELWTGGRVGPDGGLLSICAFLFGMMALVCYVRWRYGNIALHTSLAHFHRREARKTQGRTVFGIVPDEDDVSVSN
ncbi:MAG: CPBP family intramembrane metalloprotease [Chloroflexota bacterium]|nr:CPBP family intramembrane metalloprotease [Chloroflexota bacterium]